METSTACPTQYDAWDDKGQYYYLRYRGGRGSVRKYPSEDIETWEVPTPVENIVASFDYGHPLDGSITLGKFLELAGCFELAEDAELKGWGQHLYEQFQGVMNGTIDVEKL